MSERDAEFKGSSWDQRAEPKDDGGPAFPYDPLPRSNTGGHMRGSSGMSLRDWFAGQAANALASRYLRTAGIDPTLPVKTIASVSYRLADAMLEARKQ